MFSRIGWLRSLLVPPLLVLAAGTAPGQRLEDGAVEFDNKGRATRVLRQQLYKGEVQADRSDRTHQEAIEMAAKEFTYPLVWKTQTGERPAPGVVNTIVEDFDSRLDQMSRFREKTASMQQMFCRQAMERVQEVIQKGRPLAGVNAARILSRISERRMNRGVLQSEKEWADDVLPRLAEGNAEYLATLCLTLIEDAKTNDGIRYYLYRTLASLLGLPRQTPPLVKKETEEKAYLAAIKQIDKKVPFPKATPRQDVEGYKILRLQAVRTLAQARAPIIGKERPILTLARVAASDPAIVPAPRVEERVEASIGLARMTAATPRNPDIQADYAIGIIAWAVGGFGREVQPVKDSKPIYRIRPWKVDAARLNEALDDLKAAVKTPPYVQEAIRECQTVLAVAERGEQPTANILLDWRVNNEPPSTSLLRGDATAVVTPLEKVKGEEK